MQQMLAWMYRALGAGIAIALMEMLARMTHQPLSRVPFVTSIVMTFALPDAEAARPYAVICGHLLSTAAGLAALWWLGAGEVTGATAVGLAALLMLSARAVHPPAGIDAFLVAQFGLPASWIVSPVLIGAILLAASSRLWTRGEAALRRASARSNLT